MASFAMQIYLGTRILEAEGEASQPMWTENGILSGDPQAPLAAKIYLQKALKAFCKKFPFLHVDLWIDDLSFDVVDRDVENAVRIAIQAYHYNPLHQRTSRRRQPQDLGQEDRIHHLECPSQAATTETASQQWPRCARCDERFGGRLHSKQTQEDSDNEGTQNQSLQETRKLHTLKIPMRAVRLKLYKGSIQSGISWGHQALGMALQTRHRIRIAMARQMGLRRTGNADIVFDMQPRHKDPDFDAFTAQIKIYRQCF